MGTYSRGNGEHFGGREALRVALRAASETTYRTRKGRCTERLATALNHATRNRKREKKISHAVNPGTA